MATKPNTQRYADGGQVQQGGQPSLAINYADGGSLDRGGLGPWTGDLNSKTTSFNQDWLRGPNFGQGSSAALLNYPAALQPVPVSAAAKPISDPSGGGGGIPSPSSSSPVSAANTISDPMAGASDASRGMHDLQTAATLGGFVVPGLGALGTLAGIGYGYNTGVSNLGVTGSTFGANLGAGHGFFNSLSNALFGTNLAEVPAANPMQQDPAQRGEANAAENSNLGNGVGGYGAGPGTGIGVGGTPGASMGGPNGGGTGPTSGNSPGPSGGGESNGGGQNSGGQGEGGTPGASMGGPNGGGSGPTGGNNGGDADGGLQMPGGTSRPNGVFAANPNPPTGQAGLQMPAQGSGAAPSDPMHPAVAGLHVQNTLANPQAMAMVKQHIQQAVDAGKINPQQLMVMGQLAQSAMQHPELWPKLRQFAIQAGIAGPNDLPQQFNQGLCMLFMTVAQAAQHGDQQGAFANGGMLHGPGTGISDSIHAQNTSTGQPVKLSNGEYIIPADVVATKGREFFDNIVRKYHTPAAMQHGR